MGNFHISIQGVGVHHNFKKGEDGKVIGQNPADADLLFKKFVEEMKSHGHNISFASITIGGAEYK
jgi:hypothetical protein